MNKQPNKPKTNKQTKILLFAILLAVTLLLTQTQAQFETPKTITTNLTIIYNNTAPNLTTQIPNQTWATNTNLTNAFDLDNYFTDLETLTYTAPNTTNIIVIINSSTNFVSFYPAVNFSGTENTTFTAFDGYENSTSNIVFLNVVNDTTPPTWNNTRKNATTIASGDTVIFYADWQDNLQLGGFQFSINQGSGFVTTSIIPFSGTANTSEYSTTISAGGGTTVLWKFYGYDTSGNVNVTDEQSFTVQQDTTPPTSGSGSGSDGGSTTTTTGEIITPNQTEEPVEDILDFSVEPTNFRLDMKQGTTSTASVKITNTGNKDLQFQTTLSGFDQLEKTLSDSLFNLSVDESKTISATFTADKLELPDFYYGKILVTANFSLKEVLGMVQVKAINNSFDINVTVPLEYKNIKQGELASANILIENIENLDERALTLYYAITDFEGKVLNSATEELIFSGRQTLLSRNLSTPIDTSKGEYLFIARGVSEEEISLDSDTFLVGEKFNVLGFIKANLIIASIILASIIIAGFMVKHHRNKEKIRLLNLYLMMSKMNKLIKEGKVDEAIGIFIRIKSIYGEKVAKTSGDNREKLKEDMEALAHSLDIKIFNKPKEETAESKKTEESKKDDDKSKEETAEKKEEKETKSEEKEDEEKESPEVKKEGNNEKPKESNKKEKESEKK